MMSELKVKIKKPELDKFVVVGGWTKHGHDVPDGFEFDGASVPSFLPLGGRGRQRTLEPACLHDYLYARAREGHFSRQLADHLFLKDLRENKVRGAWWIWLAVRFYSLFRYGTLL